MEVKTGILREFIDATYPFYMSSGDQRRASYVTRQDPLSGNISKISVERAQRPVGISVSCDMTPVKECDFCDFETKTPQPRMAHTYGAVTVPNLFPWEKYDWITIYPPFSGHKLLLSEIYFDDLERMMESSYGLAEICKRDKEVIAFMDFTNWGAYAGASQQHPHSQRKSVTHLLDPAHKRELVRCKELSERYGMNPFEMLLKEEVDDGRRVV